MKLDIKMGDRVTFENGFTEIILNNRLLNDKRKIIKIERPKYEVIEERKELLTKEEKEFLELYKKVMKLKEIEDVKKENRKLYIWNVNSVLCHVINISDESAFEKLEESKLYRAEELYLE